MPLDPAKVEELVDRSVRITARKRFVDRQLDYDLGVEIQTLLNDIIKNVTFTIRREMDALPTSPPQEAHNPNQPVAYLLDTTGVHLSPTDVDLYPYSPDEDAGEREGKPPQLGAAP